jgi:chitinase
MNQVQKRATWFGGYLDATLVPGLHLQDSPVHGKVTSVLSFITSDPRKPCQPSWGGFYDLEEAGQKLDLDHQVRSFREAGNDAAVSFGGQLGTELAAACTDGDALAGAYAAVITRYGLSTLDFDIEGVGLRDRPAAKRRAAAVARLQTDRPPGSPLDVWLTLPVSIDGLTPDGEASVTAMLEAGVELAGVNIMTMNFGPLAPGQTMLTAAASAAEAAQRQLAVLYATAGNSLDTASLWKRIGLTPMIGTNYEQGQVFTLADAEGLNSFAVERGVGRVSMWSLNRDTSCTSTGHQQQAVSGDSNHCSGVEQDPGAFAKALGKSYTG